MAYVSITYQVVDCLIEQMENENLDSSDDANIGVESDDNNMAWAAACWRDTLIQIYCLLKDVVPLSSGPIACKTCGPCRLITTSSGRPKVERPWRVYQ